MPRIEVNSEAEALARVQAFEDAMFDFSPFFEKLEKARVLEISERETWSSKFGQSVKLSPATVRMRRERVGYYKAEPGPRATSQGPVYEWRGLIREAASKLTTIASQRATVDPDFNYREAGGPIHSNNPFSDLVSQVVPDARVWDDRVIGPRFDRELTSYLYSLLRAG